MENDLPAWGADKAHDAMQETPLLLPVANGHDPDPPDAALSCVVDGFPGEGDGDPEDAMPVSDRQPPFSWKEWVAIIGTILTVSMGWSSLSTKLDTLKDRVIDLGASQSAAVTEMRLHVQAPGHPIELERIEQLQRRLQAQEEMLRSLLAVKDGKDRQ